MSLDRKANSALFRPGLDDMQRIEELQRYVPNLDKHCIQPAFARKRARLSLEFNVLDSKFSCAAARPAIARSLNAEKQALPSLHDRLITCPRVHKSPAQPTSKGSSK